MFGVTIKLFLLLISEYVQEIKRVDTYVNNKYVPKWVNT